MKKSMLVFMYIVIFLVLSTVLLSTYASMTCPPKFQNPAEIKNVTRIALIEFLRNPDNSALTKTDVEVLSQFEQSIQTSSSIICNMAIPIASGEQKQILEIVRKIEASGIDPTSIDNINNACSSHPAGSCAVEEGMDCGIVNCNFDECCVQDGRSCGEYTCSNGVWIIITATQLCHPGDCVTSFSACQPGFNSDGQENSTVLYRDAIGQTINCLKNNHYCYNPTLQDDSLQKCSSGALVTRECPTHYCQISNDVFSILSNSPVAFENSADLRSKFVGRNCLRDEIVFNTTSSQTVNPDFGDYMGCNGDDAVVNYCLIPEEAILEKELYPTIHVNITFLGKSVTTECNVGKYVTSDRLCEYNEPGTNTIEQIICSDGSLKYRQTVSNESE